MSGAKPPRPDAGPPREVHVPRFRRVDQRSIQRSSPGTSRSSAALIAHGLGGKPLADLTPDLLFRDVAVGAPIGVLDLIFSESRQDAIKRIMNGGLPARELPPRNRIVSSARSLSDKSIAIRCDWCSGLGSLKRVIRRTPISR